MREPRKGEGLAQKMSHNLGNDLHSCWWWWSTIIGGIRLCTFPDIEFAYYAFKSGKWIKQTLTPCWREKAVSDFGFGHSKSHFWAPENGHFPQKWPFSGMSPRVAKGRQGSPRVAKVQGGPQGWVRWVKTRSIIFESFSAMIFKIKIGPIEIPIKNDSMCKKLLTPLNHSDFQKLKCFLK